MNSIPPGYVLQDDGSYSKPSRKNFVQGAESRNQTVKQIVGTSRVGEETLNETSSIGSAQTLIKSPNAAKEFRPTLGVCTDEANLNKNETSRLAYLRRLPNVHNVKAQAVTVKIGDRCRFTPDFFYYDSNRERLVLEDVKGKHVWEDSRIKVKTAARMFPEFTFIVAHKNATGWREEVINP